MAKGKGSDEHKSVFGNRSKGSGDNGARADWSTANPMVVSGLITAVASRGGAVRFGYTRDGGAYAVGFYYGTENVTKYCRPNEDLTAFLNDWADFYLELPDSNGVSPAK